ncbi:uncharacterized protein LOC132728839 [Ruditapes philippinarum]|uniref:uncharacterized protein LOC132728839 n=1 Tax=Ruditapes philippinarum TaxID=129788 RepID=UPI00295B39D5|nr:uncharacterized protein LOC132728839 [Ruditapes philippinarum]
MKFSEQVTMLLLCLVSGINTTWQERVCEGKYKGISCLGSYPCMEAFLRCDCIPLQFAGQKFEELCWTSLAYEVGAPTCCLNVKKRQHPLSKRVLQNSKHNFGDFLTSINRNKRNYSNRLNTIHNNDNTKKTTQHKKETIKINDDTTKETNLVSMLGERNTRRAFLRSIHDIVNGDLNDDIVRNVPHQKLVTDIIAAFVHSWTMPNEFKTGNKYINSGHVSGFNNLDMEDTVLKSNGVENDVESPNSMLTTENPKYFNAVPKPFTGDYHLYNHREEDSENKIPRVLQLPCYKNKGDTKLNSWSKPRIKRTREHANFMQSKILEALNGF